MPFAPSERPAHGVSLLKAELAERGIDCDVHYPNLAFAARITPAAYDDLTAVVGRARFAGEWVFADCLSDGLSSDAFVPEILRGRYRVADPEIELLQRARDLSAGFLDEWLDSVEWRRYQAVGFTSFCEQNVASLAAARLLKQREPQIFIMFGGPNWHGVMGEALHRSFPFVDIAFLGEGDQALPDVLERLAEVDPTPSAVDGLGKAALEDVPGIAYRVCDRSRVTGVGQAVGDLDALPAPDFSDYFTALEALGLTSAGATIETQTSRGCRWAERQACLFCGLADAARPYREKSAARVLTEVRGLVRSWGGALDLTDNMVSGRFLSDVLPKLAASPLGVPLFFECRPGLTREQVRQIALAGATVRVGIESFSAHILRLMNKGTSPLTNIRLLRWCKELGVAVRWNLIYGLPGETDDDYAELIALLPALRHLPPPAACERVALYRFSQYFDEAEGYGFSDPKPDAAYRFLYPGVSDEDLWDIAHTFTFEKRPGLVRWAYIERLRREVGVWQEQDETGELRLVRDREGCTTLFDTRSVSVQPAAERLDDLDELLIRACDDIRDLSELQTLAGAVHGEGRASAEEVDRRLGRFVARRAMACHRGRYLSLASAPPDGAD